MTSDRRRGCIRVTVRLSDSQAGATSRGARSQDEDEVGTKGAHWRSNTRREHGLRNVLRNTHIHAPFVEPPCDLQRDMRIARGNAVIRRRMAFFDIARCGLQPPVRSPGRCDVSVNITCTATLARMEHLRGGNGLFSGKRKKRRVSN